MPETTPQVLEAKESPLTLHLFIISTFIQKKKKKIVKVAHKAQMRG